MTKRRALLVSMGLFLCMAVSASAATYTVTKVADTNDGACDADCSLREAVMAANGTADNDNIVFDAAIFADPQTITLAGTEIVIANAGSLSITGTGADRLTISGNGASRIFTNSLGAVTTIANIKFTGGNGVGAANTGRAGAIYNNGGVLTLSHVVLTGNTAANGGATNHAGNATTTYINCEITNNSASGAGGGMQNFSGSTLTMINSSVTGNTSASTLTGGGGIQANGTLNFVNTTFGGNRANGGDGGALYYNGQGLTMNNVTIAGNVATGGGAGGLHKSTSTLNANIRNTIMAGNTGSPSPDAAGIFNSMGNNLIGTVGTSTGWVASDIQGQPALLSPLGFYGGTGMTFALLSGSPALNAANNCVLDSSCGTANPAVNVTTDQRGAARPSGKAVDIGAFESNASYVAFLPDAQLNQPYNAVLTSEVGSFTYSQTGGALPPGVTVNTGATIASVSGTPTAAGTYNFAVTVTDGTNSAAVNYRLNVVSNAAAFSVGGRVFGELGRAAYPAHVTLSTAAGPVAGTFTNPFGHYRFENVPAGTVVTISVRSKGLTYNPQTITVTNDVTGLDFQPQ